MGGCDRRCDKRVQPVGQVGVTPGGVTGRCVRLVRVTTGVVAFKCVKVSNVVGRCVNLMAVRPMGVTPDSDGAN